MTKKLLFIILPMLFFATFLNAQIKVWDFGATQLDPSTYTNMLDVATINAALATNAGTLSPGTTSTTNTINTPGVDFGGGVQYLTSGTNDRLRTTTSGITSYDTNISGDGTYVGRIYVNSAAKSDRFL